MDRNEAAAMRDPDKHVFCFTPQQTPPFAREQKVQVKEVAEQATEYFQVGATSRHQSRSTKKSRKQISPASSIKSRLPVSVSQTIDTPTIIHNILNTPIQSSAIHQSNTGSAKTVNFHTAQGSSQNDLRGEAFTAKSQVTMQTLDEMPYSVSQTQTAISTEERPLREFTDSQVKHQLIQLLENNMRMARVLPQQAPQHQGSMDKQVLLKNFFESSKQKMVRQVKNQQSTTSVSPNRAHAGTYSLPQAITGGGSNLPEFTGSATYLSSDLVFGQGRMIQSQRKQDQKVLVSNSPVSKRQASAPKARNAREKRHGNHQLAQTTSSQIRNKKRPYNSSASRNSGHTRSHHNHIQSSAQALNEVRREAGRPPILSNNLHSVSSAQTRESRGRNKNQASYAQQNVRGTSLPVSSHKKGQLASSLQTLQAMKATGEPTPVKSLAAIAISMRQGQSQSALGQHKANGQTNNPQQLFLATSSQTPQYKDLIKGNKSSSGRVESQETRPTHKLQAKREMFEREQSINTLTQSISKINACKHMIGGKSSKNGGQSNSKRNELANYLSKILSQQQKMHMNTYDQQYALYNSQENATKSKNATKSQRATQAQANLKNQGLLPAASGNLALGQGKQKRLSGVVLLNNRANNHQSTQSNKFQPEVNNQYQLTRKSQPNSNSKRDLSSNAYQEHNSVKKAAKKFSNAKDMTQSQPNLQYLKSTSKSGGKSASSNKNNLNGNNTAGGQQNSMLLQQMLYNQNQLRGKGKNLLQSSLEQAKVGIAQSEMLHNQNFWLAGKIQKAILDRKEVLEKNEFAQTETFFTGRHPFTKSNSERNIVKTPMDDLMMSEQTIVNIRAHESDNDGDLNDRETRGQSTRVEYHSDRISSQPIPSLKLRDLHHPYEVYPSGRSFEPVFKELVEVGVQTSVIDKKQAASALKESEESVSHREDKIASSNERCTPSQAAEREELAVWAKEKQALDTFALFYEEQYGPFTHDLLINLAADPSRLGKVSQQLDIFGVRLEQLISQEDLSLSMTANLFYRLGSHQILSFQKLAKLAQSSIAYAEAESRSVVLEKDDQLAQLKDQVRKLQKELFIRSEKLHLSEQMNKLKEKEVTTLRNKINAMAEAAERQSKEHARVLLRKDHEQELNFGKAARELKTLYEQNKDLFEHNKALRDDLQDQDEKVRKLVKVIQRHPSLLMQIENELDKTETKLHDQSQISNAMPFGRKRSQEYFSLGNQLPVEEPKANHGVIYVGHNKVAIPKFDPQIIEKFNKLNIDGKLPHIVETNKFDPDAVKQQVKDMFRKFKPPQDFYGDHPSDQFNSPFPHAVVVYPQHSSSGIGTDTPFSPTHKSGDSDSEMRRQLYHDSCNDVSGGERKQWKLKDKTKPWQTADYEYEKNAQGFERQVNQQLPHKSSHGFLPQVFQQAPSSNLMSSSDLNTPVQKSRKPSEVFNVGPKKEIAQQMGFVKQHPPHTIVTLQNQLYHQLVTQNNPSGSYGTPNNLQMPMIIQAQDGSNHLNILSPPKRVFAHYDNGGHGRAVKKQMAVEHDRSAPDYQSIDQPMLQTPSQTATLALELTEGMADGFNMHMMQQSSEIGASTAAFNQIISEEARNGEILSPHRHSLNQQVYLPRPRTQDADYVQSHQIRQKDPRMSGHAHLPKNYSRGTDEEEKEGTYSYSNDPATVGGGDDTTQQTHLNLYRNQQSGPTLQDQISKQYSPILRRQESLEQLNDFSPSLINEQNELSNAADGQKFSNMMRMQAVTSGALVDMHQKTSIYSLVERGGLMGLTSIDQEKSVSLLDSIAIKEEDSTQKRCIEPQSSNCVDHGGNEQTNTNQIIVEIEQQQQQHYPQQQARYYDQAHVLDQYSYTQTSQHRMVTDHKNYEFDGGEAPLDISRVDDNFDSDNQGIDQSGQDSADFLEDQNFEQQLHVGRRSSYDGHYHESHEQML